MNWFDNWCMNIVRKAWENSKSSRPTRNPNIGLQGPRINFTLFKARNGYVIQYFSKDQNAYGDGTPTLIVVDKYEDLGQSISHHILLDNLLS